MADADHTDLPPGVSVQREYATRVEYVGSEKALLAAGLIDPAWIAGLGRFTRSIVIEADGAFAMLGEGKGNRVQHVHRKHGAYCVKRLLDEGMLMVAKYRTVEDERAFNQAQQEKREQECARNTWECAKEARIENDFPGRWKNGVLHHVQQLSDFLDGRLVFEGFPALRLDPEAVRAAKEVAAMLARRISGLTPMLDDMKVERSNVIRLNDRAYWRMARKERIGATVA